MAKKQTSSRVSTIAGRVLRLLKGIPDSAVLENEHHQVGLSVSMVRTLAASVLSQDEVKGQAKRGRGPK